MKFTLTWLKRHLDTDATLDEICEKLTSIGLEVEGVEDNAKTYAPFKVAYVESAEQHPNADRLRVCRVKTDQGVLQVVCGAPNARTGMKGIFAPEGSTIPGTGTVLKKGVIRGVESCGMLVSEEEMALPETIDGIIEVDDKYPLGTPIGEIYGLGEAVIEINLTPNRADCAGVYGIARDLAAAGLGTLKKLDDKPASSKSKSPVSVTIEDTEGCPLFLGRYIKGVKNGPSPDWLQKLLKSVGLRPISALVDITNFLSHDAARPLHVYDADKLKGGIAVRKTKGGENFDALNDKSYETLPGAVGIYDDSGLIGLGGVVGGTSTSCDEKTVNVFIEAAYFNPERISRAGRDLQINSDARYRFERGVDPEFTFTGMEIATRLVLELCGGEAGELVQAGKAPDWKRQIDYDPAYLKHLIGIDVKPEAQKKILEALGFEVSDKTPWSITPPPWRGDVHGKADITEEITRITGLDSLPSTSVRAEHLAVSLAETPLLSKMRRARHALAARGMDECVTWSFIGKEQAQQFGINDNKLLAALTLKNPISSEMDVMRPSVLPGLIAAAGHNAARGYADVALCEIGPVFKNVKAEGQMITASGIRAGNAGPRHWADALSARPADSFDAKADALAALEACGASVANLQISRDAPSHYHPGRSGALRLGPNVLAYFGEIHPGILEDMDIKTPVSGFEVFLQNIPEPRRKGTGKPLLKLAALQPVMRDFAFLVDAKTEADLIVKAALAADKALIREAQIFDVYTGKGVEEGKKSLALSITIQPQEQSLTDSGLEELAQKVIASVIQKTGATLRS